MNLSPTPSRGLFKKYIFILAMKDLLICKNKVYKIIIKDNRVNTYAPLCSLRIKPLLQIQLKLPCSFHSLPPSQR